MNDPLLREKGRKDFHPKETIEESIRGVEFDFYYTGKKMGSGAQIELHITSIVRDWEENVYIRKSWYSGNRGNWKTCVKDHVRQHLIDLGTGRTMVMGLLRDFELRQGHYKKWDSYAPVYFNTVLAPKED